MTAGRAFWSAGLSLALAHGAGVGVRVQLEPRPDCRGDGAAGGGAFRVELAGRHLRELCVPGGGSADMRLFAMALRTPAFWVVGTASAFWSRGVRRTDGRTSVGFRRRRRR